MHGRTVEEAKAAASEWVNNRSSELPKFAGAYLCGSVCVRADSEQFKDTSDVDIRIVVDDVVPDPFLDPGHPLAQKKLRFRGIILEPTCISLDSIRDPHVVLADRYLAPPLARACIVADPRGFLLPLHQAVAREFSNRRWIRRRCEQSFQSARAESQLAGTPPPIPVYDPLALSAAYVFIFALIDAALIPVIASLREPTTRKSLVLASDTLRQYGWSDLAKKLVELLGASSLTRAHVEAQLEALRRAFDRAVQVHRTRFFGDFDVTETARPIVMEGAREMVDLHYEVAMHWILFNRIIAQSALMNDAPSSEKEGHSADFREVLNVLGVASADDMLTRADAIRQVLPALMDAAEDIIARNPDAVG
jgi:hypothetical protein